MTQAAPSFSHGKPLSQFAFTWPSGRYRYIVSVPCRMRVSGQADQSTGESMKRAQTTSAIVQVWCSFILNL
jgi:hypothetical protein